MNKTRFKERAYRIAVPLVLMALVLGMGACVLPASREGEPAGVPAADVVYTAAVQTVIAQLTHSAAASRTPGANPTIDETAAPGSSGEASPTSAASPPGAASPTGAGAEDVETPEPAPATPTLEAPIGLAGSDPKAALGEADWRDTFDNAENWFLPDDEHSTMNVEDGKLIVTAHQADRKDWWVLTWPEVDNFYLEATGVFGDCAERDRYGLIVHAPREADSGYLFAVACDGRFSFWFLDTETPRRITLIDWTESSFIQAGAGGRNRIGIKVEGSHFSLYANGSLLAEAEDGTQDASYFGVFAGAARTEDFTVELEEIAAWNLP